MHWKLDKSSNVIYNNNVDRLLRTPLHEEFSASEQGWIFLLIIWQNSARAEIQTFGLNFSKSQQSVNPLFRMNVSAAEQPFEPRAEIIPCDFMQNFIPFYRARNSNLVGADRAAKFGLEWNSARVSCNRKFIFIFITICQRDRGGVSASGVKTSWNLSPSWNTPCNRALANKDAFKILGQP